MDDPQEMGPPKKILGFFNIKLIINFSTKSQKVQELIELITGDKEIKDIVIALHLQDSFLFTYDIYKSAKIKGDYSDLGYDVDDFKIGAMVAVEFQLVLRNFKASKKVDAVKVYSFRLFGVYLIDDLALSTMSIPEKQRQKDDKWIVTLLKTKKTITSMNPLKC